jgi:pimeloyl-ACP methyl ester carboxylesterase
MLELRRGEIMKKFIALTVVLISNLAFTQEAPEIWTEAQSGFIAEKDCLSLPEIPHIKYIERKLPNGESFKLFTFTAKPFDPKKKSMLFIDGGPGVISGFEQSPLDHLNETHNIVSFHIRGAGCSQLPLKAEYDKFLNSADLVQDLELIREAYEIGQWELVYGISYGTKAAQLYAHLHSSKIKQLLLQSLVAGPEFLDNSLQNLRLMESLKALMEKSELIDASLKSAILQFAESFYTNVAPVWQISEAGILSNRVYENQEAINMVPMLKLGPEFFTSLYFLRYMGNTASSETNTIFLQHIVRSLGGAVVKFIGLGVDQQTQDSLDFMIKQYESSALFTPIDSPETPPSLEADKKKQLPVFSTRVNFNFNLNDEVLFPLYDPKNFPHAVKTIAYLGDADAVTVKEGAIDYFEKGLLGDKLLIMLEGLGHKYLFNPLCEKAFIEKLLAGVSEEQDFTELFQAESSCPKDLKVKLLK